MCYLVSSMDMMKFGSHPQYTFSRKRIDLYCSKTFCTLIFKISFQGLFLKVKPLSHCHEFANDMRRVSASYNSPHIATNVHELCHKRFGQNCSTSYIRRVHDIHDEISVDSCDPVRVYTILV